jgi:hypothetical protein
MKVQRAFFLSPLLPLPLQLPFLIPSPLSIFCPLLLFSSPLLFLHLSLPFSIPYILSLRSPLFCHSFNPSSSVFPTAHPFLIPFPLSLLHLFYYEHLYPILICLFLYIPSRPFSPSLALPFTIPFSPFPS